jgi:hypothetical protein
LGIFTEDDYRMERRWGARLSGDLAMWRRGDVAM